jgi:hypothetical protein
MQVRVSSASVQIRTLPLLQGLASIHPQRGPECLGARRPTAVYLRSCPDACRAKARNYVELFYLWVFSFAPDDAQGGTEPCCGTTHRVAIIRPACKERYPGTARSASRQ